MADYYDRGLHRKAHDFTEVWHRSPMAVYVDEGDVLSVVDAIRLANLDELEISTIQHAPLVINGIKTKVDKYAVVATAPWMDPQYIKTVGNRYKTLQPIELGERVEGLAKLWPVAGVMSLKKGRIFIIQLQTDEFEIGGRSSEHHVQFLTIANDQELNGYIWQETGIRSVCYNTYSAGIAGLKGYRIPHNANADTILTFLAKVQTEVAESNLASKDKLNRMFTRKLNDGEFADLVDAAFPAPKRTTKQMIADFAETAGVDVAGDFFGLVQQDNDHHAWRNDRNKAFALEVGGAYARFSDEFPYAGHTAYAAWQALTQTVNHSDLFTGARDKQMVSLFFGEKQRILERAWTAVDKLK